MKEVSVHMEPRAGMAVSLFKHLNYFLKFGNLSFTHPDLRLEFCAFLS